MECFISGHEQNKFSDGTKHSSKVFLAHFLAIVLVAMVTSGTRWKANSNLAR